MDFTLFLKETEYFCIGFCGFWLYMNVIFLICDGIEMLVKLCRTHIPFAKLSSFTHGLWLKVKREEK